MHNAAARFAATDVKGVVGPGVADYGSGAYPLTMPVYAAVPPTLPLSDRKAYAKALQYVTTTGQQPGFSPGNLPPGYAPLTASLRAQAKHAIAKLLKKTKAPEHSAPAKGTHQETPVAAPPAPEAAPPVDAAAPPVVDAVTQQYVTVAADTRTYPRWPLPFGLAIALLAGIAGPVLRLRKSFRIGRP
jgi:hypothetical protein